MSSQYHEFSSYVLALDGYLSTIMIRVNRPLIEDRPCISQDRLTQKDSRALEWLQVLHILAHKISKPSASL
ncbi:hypothetical protein HZ326_14297 [Fusarium oxysporum f. sp. albedinis]|nr:hypothetical protein HZ326_14297 [Fusarium oxysporum f. sp. albedinis]